MKKFYLDTENGIICGVCSGLSKYFNVDVLLIRILFILFFNYVIFPYILIALVRSKDESNDNKNNNKPNEKSA